MALRPASASGQMAPTTTSRWTGYRCQCREGLAYYLLNKPVGVVCTASDPQGRQTVLDLVPEVPRVYPGRAPGYLLRGADRVD